MNKEILNLFWYWINERHRISLVKDASSPWPWTNDIILQTYKFTNVFRQLDRTTKELTIRQIGHPAPSDPKLFFQIAVFRMFNWPPTYDNLRHLVFKWDQKKARNILIKMERNKEKIFTGAYIITNQGSHAKKYDLILDSLSYLWDDKIKIVNKIKKENSIRRATVLLSGYPMIGMFIGYELATDLRWTQILNKAYDKLLWANPGPGCRRGIARILYNNYKTKVSDSLAIETMKKLLFQSTYRRQKHVPPMEMRDIEHSLCEFDKYMRVYKKEGRPRSKYTPRVEK